MKCVHNDLPQTEWLLIFARAPEAGRVKTRLARSIGGESAAQFYAAMLCDTIKFALCLPRIAPRVALVFTPHNAFKMAGEANLTPIWNGERVLQSEGDLGEKMSAAGDWAFARGASRVVLIGSDSPDLPPEIVSEAFAQLENSTCEMVVSPAHDGGFTLLGMSQNCPAQLFSGIDWTQNQTLAPLLHNAANLGLRVEQLAAWFDVDEIDDLRALQTRTEQNNRARHCARWLHNFGCKYL